MIFMDKNVLQIQNFKKIYKISDKEITMNYDNAILIINGCNLAITFLEKDEIVICGTIINIKIENEKKTII